MGPGEDEPRQRPEVGERVDLLLADRDRPGEALVLARAGMPGELVEELALQPGQLLDGQRADVDAVEPPQLRLVKARRVAADALAA